MTEILIVSSSDRWNRKFMRFTTGSLEYALARSFLRGHPCIMEHDKHRPIGWVRPLGLYLEPGLCRTADILYLPESPDDSERLRRAHMAYWIEKHEAECGPFMASFGDAIRTDLRGAERYLYSECAAAVETDLAARIFAKMFELRDSDGLVPVGTLLQEFDHLGVGVFRQKHGDLVAFLHPYFRKSLSRLNSFNDALPERLMSLAGSSNRSIRVALDPDMVGWAPSYHPHVELAYWRGAPFDNDIARIPVGVTIHGSEDDADTRLYYGVLRAEFWWKVQRGDRVFEAEEILDQPAYGVDRESFGLRYAHSIMREGEDTFAHVDGAIRLYSEAEMIARLDHDIKSAGKRTQYTKLFAVDGGVSVSEWKEVVAAYFQWNPLVTEYLSGQAKCKGTPPVRPRSTDPTDDQCPYSVRPGSGPRLMISYHRAGSVAASDERAVTVLDYLSRDQERYPYIPMNTVELKKAVERRDGRLRWPEGTRLVAFEDTYTNLPLIAHGGTGYPANVKTTLEAFRDVVRSQITKGIDAATSFTAEWPTASKMIRLSLYGHAVDLAAWLDEFIESVPFADLEAGPWVEKHAEWLVAKYPEARNLPPLGEIVQLTGVLRVDRRTLTEDIKIEAANDGERLRIPRTRRRLAEALQAGRLSVARAVFVVEAVCGRCGENYLECPHSKYLDEGVYVKFVKTEPVSLHWTDRQA